jgi:hypothetical protein
MDKWVHEHMADGWHGYLLSFTFCQISGSDNSRKLQMKTHFGWFYGRLAKASVPEARAAQNAVNFCQE